MKNRKPCKLNIILFIILILAGSILFAMFISQNNSTNIDSVGGVTKEYNIWIGFDGESKDHGAKVSLAEDERWLCCAHGRPLPGWTGSIFTSDTVATAKMPEYVFQFIDHGTYIEVEMEEMRVGDLDFSEFATKRKGECPSVFGTHKRRVGEGSKGDRKRI